MEPLLLCDVDVHQLCYILWKTPSKLLMSWMNFNLLIGTLTPNPVYLDGSTVLLTSVVIPVSKRAATTYAVSEIFP